MLGEGWGFEWDLFTSQTYVCLFTAPNRSGQISSRPISTTDGTPNGGLVREIPLFQGHQTGPVLS